MSNSTVALQIPDYCFFSSHVTNVNPEFRLFQLVFALQLVSKICGSFAF